MLIISNTHTDFVIGLAGHKAAASSVIDQATLTGLDHSCKCRKILTTYFYIVKSRRRKVATKDGRSMLPVVSSVVSAVGLETY